MPGCSSSNLTVDGSSLRELLSAARFGSLGLHPSRGGEPAGGCRLRIDADERGEGGGTGNPRTAHPWQSTAPCCRYDLDVVKRHGFRRHLRSLVARGEGA